MYVLHGVESDVSAILFGFSAFWTPVVLFSIWSLLWIYCNRKPDSCSGHKWLVKCHFFGACRFFIFKNFAHLQFFYTSKNPWKVHTAWDPILKCCFPSFTHAAIRCVLCVLLTLTLTSHCCFRFVAWLGITWNDSWVPTYITTSLFSNMLTLVCVCVCVCVSGWIRFWEKARFPWIRKWGTNCTQMENLWRAWACWDGCVRWRGRWVKERKKEKRKSEMTKNYISIL